MPVLRLVGEVGHCAFCLRVLPREQLCGPDSPETLVCVDSTACCAEVMKQEQIGWKGHPDFEKTA